MNERTACEGLSYEEICKIYEARFGLPWGLSQMGRDRMLAIMRRCLEEGKPYEDEPWDVRKGVL